MKKLFLIPVLFTLIALAESCSIIGVHYKVHNPSKPGKMPVFSEETILLGSMSRYRSCFDVYYYDLSVSVNPSDRSIHGCVEIYSTALTDFDSLQIDLQRNFSISQLTDFHTGKTLGYSRRERAVFVCNPRKKGERFIMKVVYQGKPLVAKRPPWQGGFVWKKDKDNNPWIGVCCETEGASIWWPLKDHNSDEPDSMRLHYSVPRGLIAVGNGQLENTKETDQQTTYNWFISYPVNTYDVTLYIGKFRLMAGEYTGINGKKLALNHFVLERDYEKAKKHFRQVRPILKFYEQKFGEYPWYRDGYKLVEAPFAGMEHQTAIAFGNRFKNDIDSATDYIILHETAHEWWGNSVTARDFADVWLQEGFATYAEALYLESNYGEKGYMNHLRFYRLFMMNRYPVVGVRDRRWFDSKKCSDVYVKGAWILATLRNQVGNDSVFFDILKSFAAKYRYKLVESADFIAMVNEKTKNDYNWFFEKYLYDNLVPVFEYETTRQGEFYYRWANVPAGFDHFKMRFKTGNQEIILHPTHEVQVYQIPGSGKRGWSLEYEMKDLLIMKEDARLLREVPSAGKESTKL